MRRALVVGNWKMNGSKAEIRALLNGLDVSVQGMGVEVVVCPPYPYLSLVGEMLNNNAVALGAQSCCEHKAGAYTGEVAAEMLADLNCKWVIVGHSERRALFLETDAEILAKYKAARNAGLKPILCVGESLEEREQERAFEVVSAQLEALLQSGELDEDAVVAYEPVWAIGTGQTASPAQAEEMHGFIRSRIATVNKDVAENVRVLYGGSVKANNAAEIFDQTNIDGGLIGGASLVQEDFVAIAKAAS